MTRVKLLAATILSLIALLLTSCVAQDIQTSTPPGTSPTASSVKGRLEARVTDAPAKEDVTSILVTVSQFEVHRVSQTEGEEGEWLTFPVPEANRTFDLIAIKGVEKTLAAGEIEAGKYTQVRLLVDEVKVGLDGGEPQPATVPSGELKIVQPVEIAAGGTTVLVFDFDAGKSVNITGNDGIQVKPVVKLTVRVEKTGEPASPSPSPSPSPTSA